jgi:hypothetical protein
VRDQQRQVENGGENRSATEFAAREQVRERSRAENPEQGRERRSRRREQERVAQLRIGEQLPDAAPAGDRDELDDRREQEEQKERPEKGRDDAGEAVRGPRSWKVAGNRSRQVGLGEKSQRSRMRA